MINPFNGRDDEANPFDNSPVERVLTAVKKEKKNKALECMIKGFKSVFAGRTLPLESKKMLIKIEDRLNTTETEIKAIKTNYDPEIEKIIDPEERKIAREVRWQLGK